jgi:hypothetical protein
MQPTVISEVAVKLPNQIVSLDWSNWTSFLPIDVGELRACIPHNKESQRLWRH